MKSKGGSLAFLVRICLIFLICLALPLTALVFTQPAYADGFDNEFLPPVLVGGRELGLFAKMQPTYLNEDTNSSVSLQIRLFDSIDNSTITRVTYVLLVGKFDQSKPGGMQVLLNDGFYSESGPLLLNISRSDKNEVEVDAAKRPNFDAWTADPVTGKTDIKTPAPFGGGLYYVGVVIASMEDPNQFFRPESAPKFTAGLSIGYAKEISIQQEQQQRGITVISYYDKISDLNFNQKEDSFSWAMPFEWNSTRIASQNILIHHEIRLPKGMIHAATFNGIQGTANGEKLAGRNIAIDPYSSEDYLTVHFILSKEDILNMSKRVDSSSVRDIKFGLSIGQESSLKSDGKQRLETVLITDTSGVQCTIDWNTDSLSAGKSSNMTIKFEDTLTQAPIDSDVAYDLKILDNNGNFVLGRTDLIAKNGSGSLDVNFPHNQTYYIEMNVKGFLKYNNTNSVGDFQKIDTSRAGVARATVVVPEFPYDTSVSLVAVIFGSLLVIKRWLKRSPVD